MYKTHSFKIFISICKKRIYPWNEHLVFPRVNGWGNLENPATWQEIAGDKPPKEEGEDDQGYQEVSQKEEGAEAEKERPRGPGRRPSVQEPPAMGMPPETEGHRRSRSGQ